MTSAAPPPVSLVIAGAGRVFQRLYLPALSALPHRFAIAALADPDEGCRTALPGVPGFEGLEGALDMPGIDGVLVLTPPQSHAALAALTTARGLPALVEKPPATACAEQEALSTAQRALFTPAYPRRFWPAYARLKEQLAPAEPVGLSLHTSTASWGSAGIDLGPVYDVLPHIADAAIWLRGGPPATAAAATVPGGIRVRLEWPSAAHVICVARHAPRYSERARTAGTRIRLGGSPLPRAVFRRLARAPRADVVAIGAMLSAWADRLAGQPPEVLPGFEEGYATVAVIEATLRSLESGGAPTAIARPGAPGA
ncbi:MAG: Gfo/Idh/MocA family oxidoreductase [Dehalococcoidia bacterium]